MSKTPNHSSRAHALLSASSAARWLACPPSAVAAEAYPKQDTEFTREGTLAHEVAEMVARRCFEGTPMPTSTDTEMLDCAIGYSEYLQELKTTDDAVVLLEQRVDFSPWVPDGFGTCDCIILQGETMDVIDYKYGKGVAVDADHNPQMMLYALGALNDYGLAYDVQTIRMHIYQPRINNISTFEIDVDGLLAWGETTKPIAKQAAEGAGEHKPGEHCRFCPHAGQCRALTDLCTKYVGKMRIECLAPWEVADVLAMEQTISLWLKRVKEQALTTMLDGGEIPGYKVVAGRGSRNWADELEVAAELEKHGISRDQYTETKILSVAQMEKALGGKKKFNELIGGHVLSIAGSPTIAPATDKRPAYDRLAEAKGDFSE